MPDQPAIRLVDTSRGASVSFAPLDPVTLGPLRTPTRAPIAVGPGRVAFAASDRERTDPGGGVSYPIQPGKIAAPGLRDETLARTRLLDWLDVKIHSRVVFVIADAGYGKTTLLADFSRRTRLRTIWYRIDEEDRDWIGFLSHLVAAGREIEPQFAPRTASILRSLEPGGPTREDAIETFLEELPAITGDGAALILDDFHLADEVADIRQIAREIVAHGPERLSIVFASRRVPSVPVARLRTLGELAELGIADLRFSDAEMEQLFRETYGRPLEPDVLSELAKRTEGWAASLTLIQAALRERSPAETRSFVRGLSGARDELHDYLAEEVVGDLPAIQQQFLMRTSILQRVTPELAQVASGLTAAEVQSMIGDAERLGMLGRRASRRSPEQRYHPLVREFLEERLVRDVGLAGVERLHVTVAEWAETSDWRTAAHHYASAARWPDLQRVLETHLERIVASGAFSAATDFVRMFPEPPRSAAIEVIASRQASVDGDIARVFELATRATGIDPANEVAIANLISASILSGDLRTALQMAESLKTSAASDLMRQVAMATTVLVRMSVDFDLRDAANVFRGLAEVSQRDGLTHYEGVSLLNAGLALRAQGKFGEALEAASTAVDLLSASSLGGEWASACYLRASILGYLGDLAGARQMFLRAGLQSRRDARSEFLWESADIEMQIGDARAAGRLIDEIGGVMPQSMDGPVRLVVAGLDLRSGSIDKAKSGITALDPTMPSITAGQGARVRAYRALAATLAGELRAGQISRDAVAFADRQSAGLWRELASVCLSATSGQLDSGILVVPASLRCVLSLAAELVVARLAELGDDATGLVATEARNRPERWLPAVRDAIDSPDDRSALAAARLLGLVGDRTDVERLNVVSRARKLKGPERLLGKALARRLAPHVTIEDLGRVSVTIGSAVVGGGQLRRKVLALLCFLTTRPRHSATREEVLDAMWPEIEPPAAINSLNQSVYFLRRVFEPEYSEDTSAGYLHQDSDLIWLDGELVSSRSHECTRLITDFEKSPSPLLAASLSADYTARFALDFAYEDWSAGYREWLHVSYLRVIERQIRDHVDRGQFDAGVSLARRAVQIDPDNADLELSLFRLLRSSGAHSAAAEQYVHYGSLLRRDLGVEPPPMDSL